MSTPLKSNMKALGRVLGGLGLASLSILLLVQVLAYGASALQGKERVAVDDEPAEIALQPPRSPVGHHTVSEWPADRPRQFAEAPMLRERVERGELPPVEERLPHEPLVVEPPEQIGPYGGTWTRYAISASDVNVLENRLTYENLLRWDAAGENILPNLIREWRQDDDGRIFTLHLRQGIRWSDGHPFTADDILFWYEGMLTNDQLSFGINRDLRRDGELVKVEKVDDHTVRFSFKKPHGLFAQRFLAGSMDSQSTLKPKHYLSQFHPDYRERKPGENVDDDNVPESLQRIVEAHGHQHWTQTFTYLDRWQNPDRPSLKAWRVVRPPPARPVLFERNPYYWKVDTQGNQLPYIDHVEFEIYDLEIINLRIIDGLVDMQGRHMRFENYPLYMRNRKRGNYRVLNWQPMSGNEMVIAPNLNHRDPVMREIIHDRRFRIALSHGIDRQLINEAKYHGQHQPRQVAPGQGSPYYSSEYESAYTTFDPNKAEQLLDEMGLKRPSPNAYRLRPDGRELRMRIDVTQTLGIDPTTVQLVAEAWRAIGVRAEVNRVARDLFYQRKGALMHDAAIWTGEAEQLPFLDPRWILPFSEESNHAISYARWFNSDGSAGEQPPPAIRETMDLYREIEHTADPQRQAELFHRIIDLNHEHLWVIGVVGRGPVPFIVNHHMRNVPDTAATSWGVQSPGNTATEIYAIDPGE